MVIKLCDNICEDFFIGYSLKPISCSPKPLKVYITIKGLLFSVFLAALMSSISSTLNSGAALFTVDIFKKVRVFFNFLLNIIINGGEKIKKNTYFKYPLAEISKIVK